MKRTPLYDQHKKLNAKMVPFGGWDMPVQYSGIIEEYHATRTGVAIFDICHMGEFFVTGDARQTGLDRIVTQRLRDLSVGACRYGMMLNESGGVLDDLIVFRLDDHEWMIVVNAATSDDDAAHFQRQLSEPKSFDDRSAQTGKIDVQGPKSRDFLLPLITGIDRLPYYGCARFDVMGGPAVVSRTGYTGELGYEIYYPADKIARLWESLLEMGAVPAGLGARDVLRIEMGYPLYGHEISTGVSPLDAGLERFIDWEKDFIGKEALLQYKQEGAAARTMCFVADSRRSPREGQKIFSADDKEIGVVTSGTFSPSLLKGVGLGRVVETVPTGQSVFFGTPDKKAAAVSAGRPVYKNGSLKA